MTLSFRGWLSGINEAGWEGDERANGIIQNITFNENLMPKINGTPRDDTIEKVLKSCQSQRRQRDQEFANISLEDICIAGLLFTVGRLVFTPK